MAIVGIWRGCYGHRWHLEELMESFRRFGLDGFLEDFFGESGLEGWFGGASSGEIDA